MATLFDDASLVMIPSGYKDDKLYSIKPTSGDGDFTFSRDGSGASPATRVNSAGLIEKGRTNLLLQSNSFDTTWTNFSTTDTSGQSGYDGTNDAWLLQITAASGSIRQNISSSGVQTLSLYVKEGTTDWVALYVGTASPPYCFFDLTNGVKGGVQNNVIDSTITDVGNGWYRITATFDKTITDLRIFPAEANGTLASTVGDNIYIQNAQLEKGLVSTSVIETTTAAASAGILGDMPRLDYSGGASCPSLKLEPARTNVITQSEYIDGLSKTGVTITTNDTTSPEGVVNASKVAYTSGVAYLVGGSSLTTGSDYTFSGFFKADESNYVIVNQAGAGAKNAFYNLSDGTHSGASGITTDMIDYGNGWYRIVYTGNLLYDSIRIYMSGNGSYGNYPSVGEGFFAWGFQTELGSYPTSYIPTYGSATARAADSCSKTGIFSLIGQTEGTLFFEFEEDGNTDYSIARGLSISDGTYDNRIYLSRLSNGAIYVTGSVSGSAVIELQEPTPSSRTKVKAALAYSNNDYVLYVNGSQKATDTSGGVPSCSNLYLGQEIGLEINSLKKPYNQALLFKTRLTNAELAALTTL